MPKKPRVVISSNPDQLIAHAESVNTIVEPANSVTAPFDNPESSDVAAKLRDSLATAKECNAKYVASRAAYKTDSLQRTDAMNALREALRQTRDVVFGHIVQEPERIGDWGFTIYVSPDQSGENPNEPAPPA